MYDGKYFFLVALLFGVLADLSDIAEKSVWVVGAETVASMVFALIAGFCFLANWLRHKSG